MTKTPAEKIKAFTAALGVMSYARAGWDYQLPPAQRAEENRAAMNALAVARTIWAENADLQDDLREAFVTFGPLVTMSEIENAGAGK